MLVLRICPLDNISTWKCSIHKHTGRSSMLTCFVSIVLHIVLMLYFKEINFKKASQVYVVLSLLLLVGQVILKSFCPSLVYILVPGHAFMPLMAKIKGKSATNPSNNCYFLFFCPYTGCWSSIYHSCFTEALTENKYYYRMLQRSTCRFFLEISYYHNTETASSPYQRRIRLYELDCPKLSNTRRDSYQTRKGCCFWDHITVSQVQS